MHVQVIGVDIAEHLGDLVVEVLAVDHRGVDHHGLAVEGPYGELANGQLVGSIEVDLVGARFAMDEDRAGRTIGRIGVEGIVRDEQ